MPDCHPERSEAESKDPVELLFASAAGLKAWPRRLRLLHCSLDFARKSRHFPSSFEHSAFFRHSSFGLRHSNHSLVVRSSKLQTTDVFHVSCLARAKQSNKDREAHRDFGRCDCDNKENEDLRVIIGQTRWLNTKS
jgi:hypothetical protein